MGRIIFLDIINAVWDYGWYALVFAALIISIVLFAISLYKIRKGQSRKDFIRHNRYSLMLVYVLLVYLFLVISITLLSRPTGSRGGIDLIPFSTFSSNLLNNRYPFENILLFIPYGFIVPNLWAPLRKAYFCIGTGLGFSLCIELIQLITKRGFFQLDDILTNAAGTVIGYAVFYILINAIQFKRKIEKKQTGI